MILTAMGISMIVPEFIPDAKWHYYSVFTICAMIALYALFLRMQVGQHSYFFSYSYPRVERKKQDAEDGHGDEFDVGVRRDHSGRRRADRRPCRVHVRLHVRQASAAAAPRRPSPLSSLPRSRQRRRS